MLLRTLAGGRSCHHSFHLAHVQMSMKLTLTSCRVCPNVFTRPLLISLTIRGETSNTFPRLGIRWNDARTSIDFLPTMLLSTLLRLKRWNTWSGRCFLSLSSRRSADEPTQNGNEWLWAYLRDRKTFQELNEEQRRRVIDIGSHLILFTFSTRD